MRLPTPVTSSALLASIALALAACGPQSTSPTAATVTAAIAQTAGAITGQPTPMADEAEGGHHLGFDTNVYPGNTTMALWKNTPGSPYSWVGFYLPSAPCHKDASWSGKRDTLRGLGWGLAVIYVGQQTWSKKTVSLSQQALNALRVHTRCNQDFLTSAEGTSDAHDATKLAETQGFPDGTVIFLDVERMETVPQAMRDYYTAWVSEMLSIGTYAPGVYMHEHNATVVSNDVTAAFRKAGVMTAPRFWVAGGKEFDEGRAPQDVGFAFAGVWQGVIDVARAVANVRLPVDLSVAQWASPSETGTNAR